MSTLDAASAADVLQEPRHDFEQGIDRLGTVDAAKITLGQHLSVVKHGRFDDEFSQHLEGACRALLWVDDETRSRVVHVMAQIVGGAKEPLKALQPAKVLGRFLAELPRGDKCRARCLWGAGLVALRVGLGHPEAMSLMLELLVAIDPPQSVDEQSVRGSDLMLQMLSKVLEHCESSPGSTVLSDHVDSLLAGVIALLPPHAAKLRDKAHQMASRCTGMPDRVVALALLEAEALLRVPHNTPDFVVGMENMLGTIGRLSPEPGMTAADVPMPWSARLLWSLRNALVTLPDEAGRQWAHHVDRHLVRITPDCPRVHLLMLEGPREFDGAFVHHWREACRTLNVADEEALADGMEKIATASEMVLHAVPHDLGARQVLLQLLAAFDTPRDESAQSVARSHVMRDLLEGVLYHVESANDGTVLLDFAEPLKTAVRALVPGDARGIRRELLEQMASRCTVPDVRQVLESLVQTARERERPAALDV